PALLRRRSDAAPAGAGNLLVRLVGGARIDAAGGRHAAEPILVTQRGRRKMLPAPAPTLRVEPSPRDQRCVGPALPSEAADPDAEGTSAHAASGGEGALHEPAGLAGEAVALALAVAQRLPAARRRLGTRGRGAQVEEDRPELRAVELRRELRPEVLRQLP